MREIYQYKFASKSRRVNYFLSDLAYEKWGSNRLNFNHANVVKNVLNKKADKTVLMTDCLFGKVER
jgi:hypothetical protein